MGHTMNVADERVAAAFQAFHEVACARLGIDTGRGSGTLVPAALGVHRVQYADTLAGRSGSLDTLARWAETLGLEVVIPPRGPIVVRAAADALV